MGAIPVCTPFAALKETVNGDYGVKVELGQFEEALIYALQHIDEYEGKRKEMMKWARKTYDMKSLAKEWDKEFNGE
jgi:hypothetical protein